MTDYSELLTRLEKRVQEEKNVKENNRVVVEALQRAVLAAEARHWSGPCGFVQTSSTPM